MLCRGAGAHADEAGAAAADCGALPFDPLVVWPSCTNALARELPRFFRVSVANNDDGDGAPYWKHRIFTRASIPSPLDLEDDAFCICMVKDPAFWVQSLARDPLGGTFYDILPLRVGPEAEPPPPADAPAPPQPPPRPPPASLAQLAGARACADCEWAGGAGAPPGAPLARLCWACAGRLGALGRGAAQGQELVRGEADALRRRWASLMYGARCDHGGAAARRGGRDEADEAGGAAAGAAVASWLAYPGRDLRGRGDAEEMGAGDIAAVKQRVESKGLAGFAVARGRAFLKASGRPLCLEDLDDCGGNDPVVFFLLVRLAVGDFVRVVGEAEALREAFAAVDEPWDDRLLPMAGGVFRVLSVPAPGVAGLPAPGGGGGIWYFPLAALRRLSLALGDLVRPRAPRAPRAGGRGGVWDAGGWDAGSWDAGSWGASSWGWDAGGWGACSWDASSWDTGGGWGGSCDDDEPPDLEGRTCRVVDLPAPGVAAVLPVDGRREAAAPTRVLIASLVAAADDVGVDDVVVLRGGADAARAAVERGGGAWSDGCAALANGAPHVVTALLEGGAAALRPLLPAKGGAGVGAEGPCRVPTSVLRKCPERCYEPAWRPGCERPRDAGQLFQPVLFDGVRFPDAAAVWEAAVASYFDAGVFPPGRAAVVRCEDFLFRFSEVIEALADRGLPRCQDVPVDTGPVEQPVKSRGHPRCTRAGRGELLEYYADPRNRLAGLGRAEAARLLGVRGACRLGYGGAAVESWLPERREQ